MTLPDPPAPRKPRRLGLYVPFLLALALAVAWSAGWFWLRGEVVRRMDAARPGVAGGAWTLDWKNRVISGFPFRLDVDLNDAKLGEPSGGSLLAPRLKAEAFVFSPLHWVAVAPRGMVVSRRGAGPLVITAKVLRASLSSFGASPPRLSVEGLGLRLSTPPGAKPFALTAAREFHLHTRAGPNDQGAIYVEIDGATARFSGLVGRIAGGGPLNLVGDAIYSHASTLAGEDWPHAVRAWSRAGGDLSLRRLFLQAGRAVVDARSGTLTVGRDGRLRGALAVSLRQAARTLTVMGDAGVLAPEGAATAAAVVGARARGSVAAATLVFQAGRTTLGPAALGPAPRIY